MKYDETRRCPKCGGPSSDKWVSMGQWEHIERVCQRCGYYWTEEPLDADDKPRVDP